VILLTIEVLKEIRETEITAENFRRQALVNAKDIIKAAEEQAENVLNTAAQEAQSITFRIIKEKEEEANKQAALILERAKSECELIRTVSEDKTRNAVNLVIERIVKAYGDS